MAKTPRSKQNRNPADTAGPSAGPATSPWVVRILVFVFLTVFLFIVWNTAWAQSSDWVDPATDIIDDIGAGMQVLGGGVMGLAVLFVGVMAMVSGRINWQWVLAILVGGVLVFLGGTAIKELLGNP